MPASKGLFTNKKNDAAARRAIAIAHELASTMTPEQSQRCGGLVQAITAQAASFTESGRPADAVAEVIARAVTARSRKIGKLC